jgi:hypothetical protein
LLSASAARAAIVASLEQPAAGQTGVGLDEIRGFAYDTGGKEVTIRPRFDGVTFDTVLSCCDLRQDVTAQPNSGFSASINYGTLFATTGPHTVGIEVSAPGETTVVIDQAVQVIKPGNATFVTDFDLSTASCSIQGDQIVINDAAITSTGGTPVTTDLTAEFATNSQSLVFTSASGAPTINNFSATINASQEVPAPTGLTGVPAGTGTLVLDRTNNTITSCSFSFSGLTGPAIAAHIHQAPPGVAGPIAFGLNLGAGGTSPATCPAGQTLTADQVTALDQGNLYFNVHTDVNQAGEARGQLVAAAPAP